MKLKDLSLGFSLVSAVCTLGTGCGPSSSTDDAGTSGNDAGRAVSSPDAGQDDGGNGAIGDATGGDSGRGGSTTDGGAYTPSNIPRSTFAQADDVSITAKACVIDTDKLTIDCVSKNADGGTPYVFTAAQQSDGSQVGVLSVKSLTVNQSAQVAVQGSVPLVLWAETTVNIQGSMDAQPAFGASNAGGAAQTQSGGGGGAGGGGAASGASNVAGGGGGYCGVGGTGANSAVDAGAATPGGRSYGNATLLPLVAGSAGGGQGAGHEGGRGGGAIQISAGQSILVGTNGVVDVPGYGASGNGGGGGSGGAILLEAPEVTINGVIAANGGGAGVFEGGGLAQSGQPSAQPAQGQNAQCAVGAAGTHIDGSNGTSIGANATSGGGGGAGRIRINTTSGMATVGPTAVVSPPLSTACATQGVLGR